MRWIYSLTGITILSMCTLFTPLAKAETKSSLVKQPSNVLPLPHTEILYPVNKYKNAMGTALIYDVCLPYDKPVYGCLPRRNISIHANFLPTPSSLGNYDAYAGFAQIPKEISWSFTLLPGEQHTYKPTWGDSPPTWAGRFDLISITVPKDVVIQVRLYNSKTQKLGPVVLRNIPR